MLRSCAVPLDRIGRSYATKACPAHVREWILVHLVDRHRKGTLTGTRQPGSFQISFSSAENASWSQPTPTPSTCMIPPPTKPPHRLINIACHAQDQTGGVASLVLGPGSCVGGNACLSTHCTQECRAGGVATHQVSTLSSMCAYQPTQYLQSCVRTWLQDD